DKSLNNKSIINLGNFTPGILPKPLTKVHQNLGDLIISIPHVINQLV
ncbi:2781_t:CDS:1, partial [Entrophospora sp. SA101]